MPGRGRYWKLNPGATTRLKRPRKRRLISPGWTGSRPQALLSHSPKSDSSLSWEGFDDCNPSVYYQQVHTFPATPYNFCRDIKSVLAVTPNPTHLCCSPSSPPSMLPFVNQSSLNLPLPSTPYFSYFSEVRCPGTCEGDSLASHVPSEVWWGQVQSAGLPPNLDLNSPSDFHGLPGAIRFPSPPRNYTQWCNFIWAYVRRF